jgi:two-component SAPR family response regulator
MNSPKCEIKQSVSLIAFLSLQDKTFSLSMCVVLCVEREADLYVRLCFGKSHIKSYNFEVIDFIWRMWGHSQFMNMWKFQWESFFLQIHNQKIKIAKIILFLFRNSRMKRANFVLYSLFLNLKKFVSPIIHITFGSSVTTATKTWNKCFRTFLSCLFDVWIWNDENKIPDAV